MQERSAQSRGWVAGLLRAGRAVAFLTLATGINGLVAAYSTRYEPIYVYLVAVAIVALTSGLLLGVSSAVAAVIVYDWMFSPVHVVPSMSTVVPLTVAVVAALATRAARIPFEARAMLAEPVPPPLLSSSPTAHPVAVVDDERVADLEKHLASARAAVENESRLRAEATAAARMREAQLERELALLRGRANDQTDRGAAERNLEGLTAKLKEAESRVAALHQELDVAWRKADQERARADREATLKVQLEAAGRASLQQTIADLSAKHEAALAGVTGQAGDSAAELAAAHEQLEEARRAIEAERRRTADQEAAVAVARGEAEKLRNRAEKLRVHLEEERARAAREVEMRQGLQSSARENLEQTIRQISARYESELANARQRDEAKDARVADLQKALDAAADALQKERGRAERESGLRAQLEVAARETLHRTADVASGHQRVAAEAQETAAAAAQRASSLERELAELRAQVDQTVSERESALRSELEIAGREELQQAADTAAAQQRAAAQAEEKAAAAQQRASMLESHLEELRAEIDRTLAETQAHSESIESELVRARAILEGETARADREMELREQAETAAQQAQALIAETAARYESALTRLRSDSESERAAAAAAGEQVLALQATLSEERQQLAAARAERQRLMSDFDEKLQTIVAGITTDYEHSLGEALVEKEAARAELRNLAPKFQKLQDEKRSGGATDQRLDVIIAETAAKYESALSTMRQQVESARADAAASREQLAAAQAGAEANRVVHEATRAEFDRKLQDIVASITNDHEQALGEALIEREAARAEARTLSSRLQDLQRKLLGFDEVQAKVQRANDQLRAALAEARNAAAQERAAREKSEVEWNEKLQKIVGHLATDHESDVGEAMLAKEGVRAEARMLSQKVTSLQERLEEDRERYRLGAEKWAAERAALQQQLQASPQHERPASTLPTREEPFPAAARARPLVLVVHSDAGVRAMSKHTLEQAGYTILTAADGLEGLRMASQQRPDVVVAEAVMPKMNARELIQLLKSKPETADMKIVLLSSASSPDAQRAFEFRADDVVRSSADFGALRETLANVLNR